MDTARVVCIRAMDKNFFCAKLKSFEAQEYSRARRAGSRQQEAACVHCAVAIHLSLIG